MFIDITQIVFVWKKKVIYTYDGLRVSKSWVHFIFEWSIPLMGQVFMKKIEFLAISWKWAELGSLLQQKQTVEVKVFESEFIPLWDVM